MEKYSNLLVDECPPDLTVRGSFIWCDVYRFLPGCCIAQCNFIDWRFSYFWLAEINIMAEITYMQNSLLIVDDSSYFDHTAFF